MSSPSSSPLQKLSPNLRLQQISNHMASSKESAFPASVVPQAPEDPLFGLVAAYKRDTSDKKVDLGVGAYRDDNAKPWILPVVEKADRLVSEDPNTNHEYLPIAGLPEFTSASQKLIFGADSQAIKDGRTVSIQAISGTGSLHLGALFLRKFYNPANTPKVYLSNPTWANHHQIFTNVGLKLENYPYFDKKTSGLDFNGFIGSLSAAPAGSIIVLHACAHNPTGVDPTHEQWSQIADVMEQRGLFPFFDCAYQGFASGDLDRDAWAIRHFTDRGFELLVAQSYAKNFGLYGERAGCFHYVGPKASSPADATRVASQLAILQRSEISNPPAYGARIASRVLNDPALYAEWKENLRTMSGRIIGMRKELRELLEKKGTPGTWNHVTDQIGMFSFTGLTEKQVGLLREKWHVYMTKNGRASVAGLNTNNVAYVAEAIDDVVKSTQ